MSKRERRENEIYFFTEDKPGGAFPPRGVGEEGSSGSGKREAHAGSETMSSGAVPCHPRKPCKIVT